MFQLIVGTAGTGKSKYMLDKLIELVHKGEKCLLIVPEQFSKTMETSVASKLSNAELSLAEVYSFTSLLRDSKNNKGLIFKKEISTSGKAVMVNKSMAKLTGYLNSYSKQKHDILFNYSLAEHFDAFKRSGIYPQDLYSIVNDENLKDEKLKEFALIFSEYQSSLGDEFSDSEEILFELSKVLPTDYCKDTHIFIDGFESFSFAQTQLIKTFMEQALSVNLSLTTDSIYASQTNSIFDFTINTATQLILLAKKSAVKIATPIIMDTSYRFEHSYIKNIDNYLQDKEIDTDIENSVFINSFDTTYKEISYVCAKIHQLIANENLTYNDIAVVCPQLERYENIIQETFTNANIPFFIDQNRIITSSSPVLIFKSIFEVLNDGITKDSVMNLLKTRLTSYDFEVIDLLENYFYIWQDYNFDFNEDFKLSPTGIKNQLNETDLEILEKLNTLKNDLINKLTPYLAKTNTVGEILTSAYSLCEELGCVDVIKDMVFYQETLDKSSKELLNQEWEAVMQSISQLYDLTFEDVLNPKQVLDLFTLMVSGTEIGFAPQTQDCLMITSPSRMKINAVKVCFVIGAAQDVFPAQIGEDNIITAKDIEYLKTKGFELKNNLEMLYSFEMLYFYKTLTTASDKLFISHAKNNVGSQQLLSSELITMQENLNIPSDILAIEDYCITKDFFKDYILQTVTIQNRDSIIDILQKLDIELPNIHQKDFAISDLEYLNEVLGDSINLSATNVESYHRCPFLYFLNYTLKIYPLEKANFTQRLAGNYLHFIAYKVLKTYGSEFYKTEWDIIDKQIDIVVAEYVAENYPSELVQSVQFTAQQESMKNNAKQLIQFLHIEQQHSQFRPIAFEERLGFNTDTPPLKIKANDKTAYVGGICDRIDLLSYENQNYLRILDYKTGIKKFNLDDVYNGISSQLLIYMNILLDNKFKGIDNLNAGAIVYQPSDISFKFDDDNKNLLYKPIGMALKDEVISKAFDDTSMGRFGVIKGETKVTQGTDSSVLDKEGFDKALQRTKDNIQNMVENIYKGDFDCMPLENSSGVANCSWCGYKSICQNISKSKPMEKNDFK